MTGPVVVVGDSLLDRDIVGSADRVCPDAAAPVVDIERDLARPGGAGLAALLAARTGAHVVLVTALARDAAGSELRGHLEANGIDIVDLGLDGRTAEKIRVRARGSTLVRIDRGERGRVVAAHRAEAACRGARAILVSDYGRGVTATDAVRDAIAAAASTVPVVWDPHPKGAAPVPAVQLLTPNERELIADSRHSSLGSISRAARDLAKRAQAHAVAVTLGERGALLTSGDGVPLVVPAEAVDARDTCGAGDCFAATAAVRLAAGAVASEAVQAAVDAASVFVAAGGAASVAAGDGHVARRDRTALEVVAHVRARGGTVVATGGCFDLLHPGHVSLLKSARALGDCLVVLLNSDASVRRLKGRERPLQPAADRAAVLRALEPVDAVEIFDDDTPTAALERLRPDVFVKGGDYALGELPETNAVREWNGEVVVVPYLAGRSTTRLLEEARSGA